MSDYSKTTDFAAKDALLSGDPDKVIVGTEIDDEFNNIETAVATKANSASPTFTGTVTAAAVTTSGAVTMSGTLSVDTISEKTAANGVTIDSVSLKDGGLTIAGSTLSGSIKATTGPGYLAENGTEVLSWDSGSSAPTVGIGNTNPTTYTGYGTLAMGDTASYAGYIEFADASAYTGDITAYATTGGMKYAAESGTVIQFAVPTEICRVDAAGLKIAGTASPTSGVGTLCIFNGTAPTGSVTNGVVLYSEDVTASAELKVRDEAGNVTTLSPHNFSLIPDGPSEDLAWAFYSERNGKKINVDMLKLARMVEQLTGEQLVYEG